MSIIPGLKGDDPYRAELESSIRNYNEERKNHVRRVTRSLGIMLDKGFVPDELVGQAEQFRTNWGKVVEYFK